MTAPSTARPRPRRAGRRRRGPRAPPAASAAAARQQDRAQAERDRGRVRARDARPGHRRRDGEPRAERQRLGGVAAGQYVGEHAHARVEQDPEDPPVHAARGRRPSRSPAVEHVLAGPVVRVEVAVGQLPASAIRAADWSTSPSSWGLMPHQIALAVRPRRARRAPRTAATGGRRPARGGPRAVPEGAGGRTGGGRLESQRGLNPVERKAAYPTCRATASGLRHRGAPPMSHDRVAHPRGVSGSRILGHVQAGGGRPGSA